MLTYLGGFTSLFLDVRFFQLFDGSEGLILNKRIVVLLVCLITVLF